MAADPESLDVELAASVFKEMGEMIEEEAKLRQAVQEMVKFFFLLMLTVWFKDDNLALFLVSNPEISFHPHV